MTSKILVFVGLIAFSFTMLSFVNESTLGDPWPVPAKYETMANPVKATSGSISVGKMLYSKHCKSCHGKTGLGDGPKAAQLDTPSGDFSDEAFKAQSDGALFYKTKTGRDDMPSYEKKIRDEEDLWNVVNYMRTLK